MATKKKTGLVSEKLLREAESKRMPAVHVHIRYDDDKAGKEGKYKVIKFGSFALDLEVREITLYNSKFKVVHTVTGVSTDSMMISISPGRTGGIVADFHGYIGKKRVYVYLNDSIDSKDGQYLFTPIEIGKAFA